ncbi:uncharacterized protein SPAPADRAFT_67149 [Spathaspora passalidarum NRRL Y-27907]|uniref:Uncharacterized protein n=1 Tax=Spathaspora passalidarum (strain NRRL Y-27907 / 11-Y1) TaxID=619300 RepID=G3ANL6_SPAPN|nr:uncharacterized protein SPAPADRAFT_67149 [Spathaspora passalidarum NRRL Y-27907]EGW32545.1 hypothetical protein SPAPADRAFT_67149 [Spathaspora passalidarum NRRL Y-27907]
MSVKLVFNNKNKTKFNCRLPQLNEMNEEDEQDKYIEGLKNSSNDSNMSLYFIVGDEETTKIRALEEFKFKYDEFLRHELTHPDLEFWNKVRRFSQECFQKYEAFMHRSAQRVDLYVQAFSLLKSGFENYLTEERVQKLIKGYFKRNIVDNESGLVKSGSSKNIREIGRSFTLEYIKVLENISSNPQIYGNPVTIHQMFGLYDLDVGPLDNTKILKLAAIGSFKPWFDSHYKGFFKEFNESYKKQKTALESILPWKGLISAVVGVGICCTFCFGLCKYTSYELEELAKAVIANVTAATANTITTDI